MATDLDKKIVQENVLKVIDEITKSNQSNGNSGKVSAEKILPTIPEINVGGLRESTNNNVNVKVNTSIFNKSPTKSSPTQKVSTQQESFKKIEGFKQSGFNPIKTNPLAVSKKTHTNLITPEEQTLKAIQETFDNIISIEETNNISSEGTQKVSNENEKKSDECEILNNTAENLNKIIGIFKKESGDSINLNLLKDSSKEHVNVNIDIGLRDRRSPTKSRGDSVCGGGSGENI